MVAVDERLSAAKVWLEQTLGYGLQSIEAVSGDASFRRYFRVTFLSENAVVVAVLMDAPPDKEDVRPFVAVARQLEEFAVLAPQILAENIDQGFLLISDLGNEMFYDRIQAEQAAANQLYPQALAALASLQIAASQSSTVIDLPPYDQALLNTECQLFEDWLVQRHLGQTLPKAVAANIAAIVAAVEQQPYGFVHRDYHSRNLMLVDEEIAMIDFQDAVVGPVTYDAASLLKDAYLHWPQPQLDNWLAGYYQQLFDAELIDVSLEQFQRWFDWMGLQRHIKVAGIFCRLNYRDGKAAYMNDIPLVLDYIVTAAGRYPELAELRSYVESAVLPEFSNV